MNNILFSATGCIRCKIAKKFMAEQEFPYEELDIKGEGMEAFRKFYGANRSTIFRGKEGVEFPVFTDGKVIRQGVGVLIAYLLAGTKLDGFIGRSELLHGWIDGLHISGGDPSQKRDLITVLKFLKTNGLKLQFDTNGRNAAILEQMLEHGIGDRVVMEIKGPLKLFPELYAENVNPKEIENSIGLVARFPEYQFQTTVAPVVRQKEENQEISYLTPEEISKTAELIEKATGSKKHPYLLKRFNPTDCSDERLKTVEALQQNDLFQYRTAARRYMVLAEIEKQ